MNAPPESTAEPLDAPSEDPTFEACTFEMGEHVWRYQAGGTGRETLVFLIGGLGEGGPMPRTARALGRQYRLLAVTYPPLKTIGEVLKGLIALLDHERVYQAHFFGASLGGAVAQCLVRAYPDRVRSLLLANTAGPVGWAAPAMRGIRGLFNLLPFSFVMKLFRRSAVRLFPDTPAEGAEALALFDAYLDTVTKPHVLALFDYLADYHGTYTFSEGDLDGWTGRILILESDDDPGVQRRHRERLKRLYPTAQVHTFHKGGHTPSLRYPEAFQAQLEGFLGVTNGDQPSEEEHVQ